MKGLVFDFELYTVRIVTTSDSSRQITFYFDESKISRREGANIIRKCKKDWPFLKDGNTIVKTDCFENFYEKFEDKTDDLILLDKKRQLVFQAVSIFVLQIYFFIFNCANWLNCLLFLFSPILSITLSTALSITEAKYKTEKNINCIILLIVQILLYIIRIKKINPNNGAKAPKIQNT